MVEEVCTWLHGLRRDDRELSHQVADVIQTVLDEGPGLGRPLVDSLSGAKAKAIRLKEMRAVGTIRIAFVYHGGTILLLLAVSRYERWRVERGGDDEG